MRSIPPGDRRELIAHQALAKPQLRSNGAGWCYPNPRLTFSPLASVSRWFRFYPRPFVGVLLTLAPGANIARWFRLRRFFFGAGANYAVVSCVSHFF